VRHSLPVTIALGIALGSALTTGLAAQAKPQVTLETNRGAILIELDPEKAPKTVANFLEYVRAGSYDGTIFHRVIDGFMIQGGGFDGQLAQKETRAPIQNESDNGLSNARGTIAMARTNDPHSATAQFFINLVDNDGLDHGKTGQVWGYAVFGKVLEGMDVVDAIAKVETGMKNGMANVPTTAVTVQSAKVVE
jgi:cyclophilin family peptidyl-prolyl cis-trans isomerase